MNNLCEIERKLSRVDHESALRNVQRIKDAIEDDFKLFYEDPIGRPFKDTQTDVEATITGSGTENLVIVETIKPIIRCGTKEFSMVVQKGIVLVQSNIEGTAL
jgi:hypothetical protein